MNNRYLIHYNKNHDKLGRFTSGPGGGSSRSAQISTRINKIDNKTGKLQIKSAKYKEKASKYNRKANKIKRMATNPIIGRTDFREAANYASLRAEGKGLKYTHKAEKLNKKISKLDQERVKLGKERVKEFEKQYPDVFEPGWRDKYNDPNIFDITPTKKGNTHYVKSVKR